MDINQKELRYKAYVQDRKLINQVRQSVILKFAAEEDQLRHKKLRQQETQQERNEKFDEELVQDRAKKNLRHLYQKVLNQRKKVPYQDKELQQLKIQGWKKFNMLQIKETQNSKESDDADDES